MSAVFENIVAPPRTMDLRYAITREQNGGFGSFHARLMGSLLQVTVRVHWKFVKFHDKKAGPPGTPEWTLLEQQQWQAAAEQGIVETWSRKWKFRRGLEEVVPVIVIQSVGADAERDFLFEVANHHGGAGLVPKEKTVEFYKNDAIMADDWDTGKAAASGIAVASAEHERLQSAFELIFGAKKATINLLRTGDSWGVSGADQAKLGQLAMSFRTICGAKGLRPPLVISTSSGNTQKARNMAQAVERQFKRLGGAGHPVTEKLTVTSAKWHGPFHKHSTTGTAELALSDFDMSMRTSWFNRYRVSDHEFGHCLGLPDEYMASYPPDGEIGVKPWNFWHSVCDRAAVRPNIHSVDRAGKNRSIMSCGWVTNACHYVTIWDALTKITGDESWTIVRGTEADTM